MTKYGFFAKYSARMAPVAAAVSLVTANYENPELFITLPWAIIKGAIMGHPNREAFNCPRREELDRYCRKEAGLFDLITILPVNHKLDDQNVPLSQKSLDALKQGIDITKQEPQSKKHLKTIFEEAAKAQQEIAKTFRASQEGEGATRLSP